MTENEAYGVNVHNDVTDRYAPNKTTTNVSFTMCYCIDNDIQGLRTQGAHGIRVTGGQYNGTGGCGIQIEQNSHDIVIDGVEANNNGNLRPGEKGIWIDEATNITVKNSVMKS